MQLAAKGHSDWINLNFTGSRFKWTPCIRRTGSFLSLSPWVRVARRGLSERDAREQIVIDFPVAILSSI
jgi:hypothetical protein